MASKSDLEARETDCSSAEDFATLANEALADPADNEYAKELLQKAEIQCQMPLDYVNVGDAAVTGLGDKEYAKELYEQAEDMLFEVPEFTAYARSMATLGDQDKAREFLEKAADDASQPAEFLAISKIAQESLGDPDLAKTLLAKVEEKAKSFDDFKALANDIKASGDEASAKELFKKAARFCDDVPASVNYAKEIIALFDDQDWARQVLDDAEADCQFTKQFVQLAKGYKDLFDDTDKVNKLMDQAAEFCMSGEEHVDLADGYWTLMQDKTKAAESYDKALAEITDKEALLALAKRAATEMQDVELAKKIYAKTEQRMSSASEFSKLAQAVISDLKDNTYAAEIYDRTAENLVSPNDLTKLATEIVIQLGDKTRAENVYRKAFDKAGDFKQLVTLLDQSHENISSQEFSLDIINKAESTAQESSELVELAGKTLSLIDNKEIAARILESAEEQVTSLGELKSVTEAIKTHFADNTEWIAQVEEKLTKRQANQKKYDVFQTQENHAESTLDHLKLASSVMETLDDKYYAKKLLSSAEQAYQDDGYDFNTGRALVLAINQHLGDQEWVTRLLDDAAERCTNFTCVHEVGYTASSEISENGKALAKKYYEQWTQKLDTADQKNAYDYIKLAKVVSSDLEDNTWAHSMIDKAVEVGGDHFAFAQMGAAATQAGDQEKAKSLYQQAANHCDTPVKLQQLAKRLKSTSVDSEIIKELYTDAKSKMNTAHDRLRWTEGITQIFNDKDWASQAYDELAGEFSSANDVSRFHASRQSHLRAGLW